MPDLDEVKEQAPIASSDELLLSRLFEYMDEKHNPWRADWLNVAIKCYNFVELKQWDDTDAAVLRSFDVPPVPIDRINRGIDTIEGIRKNSNLKKRISKRELGDERIANLLDKTIDQVTYKQNFASVGDQVFEDLLPVGIGIKKVGFDPKTGDIWSERVNPEDFGYSRCKNKDLSDITWCWHTQVLSWEDAMMVNPDKAGQLKSMRSVLESEWEKKKGGFMKGSASAQEDYNASSSLAEKQYSYPDSVELTEFWVLRRVPIKKVGAVVSKELAPGVFLPVPEIREEGIDYMAVGNEEVLGSEIKSEWHQYIVAGDRKSNILLKEGLDDNHPFVGYIAKRKKSGQPMGYVETVIPHQERINLSWAQKMAWNNKAIKSPLILTGHGAKDVVLSEVTQQSSFGAVLRLPEGVSTTVNQTPNVNMQAIEEGNVARADMDFAAAATEEPLRGISDSGTSGIKLSLAQNAAITPLNKWVNAFLDGERTFTRKVLSLIIRYYPVEKMARIVGEQEFLKIMVGPTDPMTGMPTLPPLQFPISLDVLDYDVVIEDQSISDFNKQQSFNATEALVGGGVLFDDEFRIKNAPIKDVDGAITSNAKAKQDLFMMMVKQASMSQAGNAVTGQNAPQAGKRSMVGGQNGLAL